MAKRSPRCGKMMPVAAAPCVRPQGHKGPCESGKKRNKAHTEPSSVPQLVSDGVTVYAAATPEQALRAEKHRIRTDLRIIKKTLFKPYFYRAQQIANDATTLKRAARDLHDTAARKNEETRIQTALNKAVREIQSQWEEVERDITSEANEASKTAERSCRENGRIDHENAWLADESLTDAAQRIASGYEHHHEPVTNSAPGSRTVN